MRWLRKAPKVIGMATLAVSTAFLGVAWAAPPPTPIEHASYAEITIDGHSLASFKRCSLSSDDPAIAVADDQIVRIICERGLSRNIELQAWHELVVLGDVAAAKKNFSLSMYSATGDALTRWHVTEGYPKALTVYFDEDGVGREIATFTGAFLQRVSV
jgi:hypothetical protein